MKDVEVHFALSPLQEGMLFHCLMEADSGLYCSQLAWSIEGPLDERAFTTAWETLVERHAALRTFLLWERVRQPKQVVLRQVSLPLRIEDWAGLSAAEQQAKWAVLLQEDRAAGIRLDRAPLFRLALVSLGPERHYFLWTRHHVLMDGWSAALVLRELFEVYPLSGRGLPCSTAPAKAYKAYVDWLETRDRQASVAFWETYLRGFDAATPLPLEDAPAGGEGRLATGRWELSADVNDGLVALTSEAGLTSASVITAAWGLALALLTGRDDVVFGTTVSGRPAALDGVESIVGLFINTIPVRVQPQRSQPTRRWLECLQHELSAARQHELLPLVDIQSCSAIPRGTSLFQTLLVIENFPSLADHEHVVGRLRIEPIVGFSRNNYPLTVKVRVQPRLSVEIAADGSRLNAGAVEHIWRRFEEVLTRVVRDVDAPLDALLRADRGGAHAGVPVDGNVARVSETLEDQLQRYARDRRHQCALTDGIRSVSYGELDERATALSSALRRAGAGPERPVALLLERSLETCVAMVGVLKAGAAFAALDPTWPVGRLRQAIVELQPVAVIASFDMPVLAELALPVLEASGNWRVRPGMSKRRTEGRVPPSAAAYFIHTSGTTGKPKAVVVERRHLAAYLQSITMRLQPAEGCSFLFLQLPSVDLGYTTLFASLATGGVLHIPPGDVALDGALLTAYTARHRIDVMKVAPSHLKALLANAAAETILPKRLLILGGEPATLPWINALRRTAPDLEIWNHYGPAETTIGVVAGRIAPDDQGEMALLGVALPAARVYVLDKSGRQLPPGVPGNIFIGGETVSRGYAGQPGLTAERFFPDAFVKVPGARMYSTGDRGLWTLDGRLRFVGRGDGQVKIRGFRVETGEVEACLGAHEDVAAAAVVPYVDADGTRGLCAYVALRSGAIATRASLLDALRRQLPGPAVPDRIVLLDRLPLLPSGKVDRRALPPPGETTPERLPDVSQPLEDLVGAVWASVLGTSAPAAGDNFFALGGHSLLATRVIAALRRTLEIDIPIRGLFEHPTLGAFTSYVRTIGADPRTAPPALGLRPRSDVAPLSFAQQRLWFLDLLAPGNASYHTRRCMRIRGALEPADLKRSLEYITARHEVLRSVIEPGDGDPRQRVLPAVDVPFAVVDLHDVPRDLARSRVEEHAVGESRRGFDLARGPLLRATLYRLAEDEWMLLVVMHHIVSDGWSRGVFLRELVACYRAIHGGKTPELPPLPVQYADFAIWQRDWLRGEALSRQLEYWRTQLDGIATLRLPTDFPRTSVPSFDGATVSVAFSEEITEQLLRLAQRESVTPFMVVLGLVHVLLHRVTGGEDIAIGTSVANRTVPEIEPLIGFFVNTLVMRGRVSSRTSFRALLADVRRQSIGAFMHQDIPFERLVEELQPRRDPARNPFFQVSLAFQNAPEPPVEVAGLVLENWAAPGVATRFDLEFHALVHRGQLQWEIYYNTALFHAQTVQRFAGALEQIAAGVVAGPECPVGRIPLMSVAGAAEPVPALPFVSMLSCLERWARERGDAPAVIDGERRLDYEGLRRRAALWAQHLRAHQVTRGGRIGLAFESGADTITGIFAAFMAGCAYVPLDVSQPRSRLERMRASAALVAVLSNSDFATVFPRAITVEQLDMPADATVPTHVHVPDDEAYVIFTSGSTGTPKGVVVSHGNLAWSTRARERYYGSQPSVFLLLSSFAFDSSVAGIFWTLANGGTLVVASADARRDPREIGRLILTHRITHTLCLPSLYQATLRDLSLRRQMALESVIVAGEPCTNEILTQHARLLPRVRLFNEYGPTEGTVWATVEDCVTEPRGAEIAIGRPIPGASCHVLDETLCPVPDGFLGELYIGGPGVAAGYAGEPELTAARFVPDSFSRRPGSRLYATGDLVRRGVGGALEFFGRADHQVKIRGHRVELGEIESALRVFPAVEDCCVTARGDGGETTLAAYVQWTREALDGGSEEALCGWQDVFEHEYRRAADADGLEHAFVGWMSSYTGQPIPHVEMSAWLQETVERILALAPRAIVELGCGTGLLVLALAPHCEQLAASDVSESAIRRLRAEVESRRLQHVTLECGMAHEVSEQGRAPDLVVMNSVVQYFPSVEYLERVLDRCLSVLAPGGRIFIGDVRHLDLLPVFHASVERVRTGGRHSGDVLARVRERVEEETELAVSPLYFADLKNRRPELQRVRIMPKLFDADNELSLFRYDVVLDTSAAPLAADVEWRDWPAGWSADAYHDVLIRERPAIAAFRNIPHAALERELAHITARSADIDQDVVGLRPRDVAVLGAAAGYDADVSWARGDERGRFDIICTRRGVVKTADVCAEVAASPDRRLANNPSAALRSNRLLVELRQFAAERLPAAMHPTLWTAVRCMPRTATGKLDRGALPVPREVRPAHKTYRPPASPVQEVVAGIWAAVLRRTQIGIDDNFFDLGGHSLMATQVISRVREAFDADVPLGTLFRAPTVEAFASALVSECADARDVEIRARILLKVWAAGPAAHAGQSAEVVVP